MLFTRTTVRLEPSLKKEAELKALELNLSFQSLFSEALRAYLRSARKKKAKRIIFHAQSLGDPTPDLTREDFYAD
jgi:hypothetical protein